MGPSFFWNQVLPLLPQLKTSDLHRLGTVRASAFLFCWPADFPLMAAFVMFYLEAVLDELTKRARSAQKAERAEL